MTAGRDDLSELELDALTEAVNLGVSRAASNLSEMVTEQVHLSVPSVLMIGRERAIEILNKSEPSKLVAVHQIFEGEVSGRALVIFPEAKSLELVRAVTSAELSLEDIIELEHEALAETGNVILNSCLATIANQLISHVKDFVAGHSARRRSKVIQLAAACRMLVMSSCSCTSTSRSNDATSRGILLC